MGDDDFLLAGGEASLEGGERLPERSSDVNERLALWELSDRSLQVRKGQRLIFILSLNIQTRL